ncbi:TerB family tellurite resistance protein [Bacteroides sp. OttesenSCG-928-D19]|nr:TerB family tellurite resistance protein [Bacteroides sp. OttesenSCG-928-D19]
MNNDVNKGTKQVISWDNVMNTALSMPGIKVNRMNYLFEAFSRYGNTTSLDNKRPVDVFGHDIVEKIANDAIKNHLLKVTAISAVAGMPGGFAMGVTIPADIAQYYWHVLVLAQKLGYIYGWPDLLNEKGEIDEGTKNILTIFVGVMLGAQAANKVIGEISKQFATQIAKRLPQKALTKTFYYPVIKQIAKWIGIKLTKDSFAKGVSKTIPLLGGIVSGTITAVSFNPMANKLQKELRNQMVLYKSLDSHFYFEENILEEKSEDLNIDAKTENTTSLNLEALKIQACINIAKIDFDLAAEEVEYITNMIEEATLNESEKLDLLSQLHTKELVDIDFTVLKKNTLYSTALIENLIAVVNIDNIVKPAEKIYLFKIAHDLGFNREDVKDMLIQ